VVAIARFISPGNFATPQREREREREGKEGGREGHYVKMGVETAVTKCDVTVITPRVAAR